MVLEIDGVPEQLMARVKEAAAREGISVPDLVREALELRVNGRDFAGVYAIAHRHGQQLGITAENVESVAEAEIAAYRQERAR